MTCGRRPAPPVVERRAPARSVASSLSRAREPLGQPAGVGEHDRRAVRLDQVEHPLLDVRPDRRAALGAGGRAGEVVGRLADRRHVLDRHDDLQLDGLLRRRLHDRRPAGRRPRNVATSSTGRTVADSPMRCAGRSSSASSRSSETARCAPRLVRADGVHLVDDHRVDAAQRLARGRGQQQEQRLGRGDQDVGRAPGEQPALVGRGVAGAHRRR